MSYVIGIDGGSQSTKVVVYDLSGRVVCQGHQRLRTMSLPAPGHVEHPGDDLWDSLVGACRAAMDAFPGDPSQIVGAGLCSIRFCRALLREDGKLAAPVLSWMDDRVSRPYRHEDPAVSHITTASGYLTRRLTGERRDAAAGYRGQWPVDTDTWDWSTGPAAYDATGMTRSMLFELAMPGEVLGHVTATAAAATGLPDGLPVVATANDKAVEALGCGVVRPDVALVSLGTYIAAMLLGNDNRRGEHFWTNFASLPGGYLYESHGIRRGMWTVSWLRDLVAGTLTAEAAAAGDSVEDLMNSGAAAVPPGSDGLMTVLDWLPPTGARHKRGMMIGFDQRHGWAHMYRSVLEGIALTTKTRLEAMRAELGRDLSEVVVSGGGASSAPMMQIVADVLGLPAHRFPHGTAASRGAAVCAAVGAGAHPDFPDATRQMVGSAEVFKPRLESSALYRDLHRVYESIPAHVDPILVESHAILR